MTAHGHSTYVPGCFRCDLSREECCPWDGSEETEDQCICPGLTAAEANSDEETR